MSQHQSRGANAIGMQNPWLRLHTANRRRAALAYELPFLEYLSVIQAAKMLPYWMKDQGRWSEAFLAVVIDGMVVGRGGILRRS